MIGGSGLDPTDDFQTFCGSGLGRIQLLPIRIGLGLKNLSVRSSLLPCVSYDFEASYATGRGCSFKFTYTCPATS